MRLVLALPAGGDEDCSCCAPEPHPDLVAKQNPTPAQVMRAVAVLGAFPDASYLAGEIPAGGR